MHSRNASLRFYGVCETCFKEQWKHHASGQPKHCYCPHHQALAYESHEGVSIRTNITIEEYNQIIARSTVDESFTIPQRRKIRR
ncbi:MAG: hypothetical protein HQL75_12935 [Magnetococcales bacterium]|nr:hypothetical protein [Magnetococcales bacterium]